MAALLSRGSLFAQGHALLDVPTSSHCDSNAVPVGTAAAGGACLAAALPSLSRSAAQAEAISPFFLCLCYFWCVQDCVAQWLSCPVACVPNAYCPCAEALQKPLYFYSGPTWVWFNASSRWWWGLDKCSVHSWACWLHICSASEAPGPAKQQRCLQLMRDLDLLCIPLPAWALSTWGDYTSLV